MLNFVVSEIFKGTDYPSFNNDGTFSWDGKTFDFRQDKKYTSYILAYYSYTSTGGNMALKDYVKS